MAKQNRTSAGSATVNPKRSGGPTAPTRNRAAGRAGSGATPDPTSHVQPRRAERRSKELFRERREERLQAYERRRRQWLYVKIGLIAFAAVVVIGTGYVVWRIVQDQQLNVVPDGTLNFSYQGGEHIQPGEPPTVAYAETPPVGGRHDPNWQNCGFYPQPIRSENAVHSLEHGAVWITYQPNLPADQIEILRQQAAPGYVVISPFEGLPTPVVVSAWNHQLQLDNASDPRLDQFVRKFRLSTDAPERGALCSGGVGQPA